MALTPVTVNFDSRNPRKQAEWWADVLGSEIVGEAEGYVFVDAGPLRFAFQPVDDPRPDKNVIHVDLSSTDLEGDMQRLLDAGALVVGHHAMESGFNWTVLSDPEGNQFCIASPPG